LDDVDFRYRLNAIKAFWIAALAGALLGAAAQFSRYPWIAEANRWVVGICIGALAFWLWRQPFPALITNIKTFSALRRLLVLATGLSLVVQEERRAQFWRAYLSWLAAWIVALSVLVLLPFYFIEKAPEDFPDFMRSAMLLGIIYTIVLPKCFRWGNGFLREWKQLSAPSADMAVSTDPRPQVLYLRRFINDGLELPVERTRPGFLTYEMAMVNGMRTLGPCVAIGRPDEELPELGAARVYVSNEKWQAEVSLRLVRSQFAVFNVSSVAENFLWEIEQAFKTLPPNRIILMFSWRKPGETGVKERETAYAAVKEVICRLTALNMPESVLNACFILFGKDSSVIVIGDQEHPQSRRFEQYVATMTWLLAVEQQSLDPAKEARTYHAYWLRTAKAALELEPKRRLWAKRRIWLCALCLGLCAWRYYLDDVGIDRNMWWKTEIAFAGVVFIDLVAYLSVKRALKLFKISGDKTIFGVRLARV